MNFSQLIYTSMVCLLLLGGAAYGQKSSIPLRLKVSTDLVLSQVIRNPTDGQILAGGNSLSAPSVSLMMPGVQTQDLQEISLLIPAYAQANTPIQLSLGLGYQYNWVFTPKWEKLKLYLGGGVQADLKLTLESDGTLTLSHTLSRRGNYDLDVRIHDEVVATYVINIKGKKR